MLVSVVIPTFNRQDVLFRAIDSVEKQEYQEWELLIVDDGSTDETETLVKEYIEGHKLSNKVFYYQTPNRGVSAARNLGIRKARGEWVAFLDSDDEWLPHKLNTQLELAQKKPELPLIHGEEIWVRKGHRVNPKKKHTKSGGKIFQRCLELCLISPSAVMIKRSVLEQFGGFNEEFPVCEDYDLWLKLTVNYEVGFVETPIIVKYGGHQDQLSQKFKAMDYWRVKSMCALIANFELSKEDLKATLAEVVKKAQVLVQGYAKHNHLRMHREMAQTVELAHTYMSQIN